MCVFGGTGNAGSDKAHEQFAAKYQFDLSRFHSHKRKFLPV